MRPIGFSTGALALSDFRLGLAMTQSSPECSAMKLSALRQKQFLDRGEVNHNKKGESCHGAESAGLDY